MIDEGGSESFFLASAIEFHGHRVHVSCPENLPDDMDEDEPISTWFIIVPDAGKPGENIVNRVATLLKEDWEANGGLDGDEESICKKVSDMIVLSEGGWCFDGVLCNEDYWCDGNRFRCHGIKEDDFPGFLALLTMLESGNAPPQNTHCYASEAFLEWMHQRLKCFEEINLLEHLKTCERCRKRARSTVEFHESKSGIGSERADWLLRQILGDDYMVVQPGNAPPTT